jgi:membrane protein YqaA with SNARE-associated domain
MRNTLRATGIIVSILVLFLFLISLIYRENILSLIATDKENALLWVLFLLSFLMEFIPQYTSSHLLLINLAILDISLFYPIIILTIGSFLGSVLGFEMGRKASPREFQKKKLKKVRGYISKYGKIFMAIAAISPLPYFPTIFGFLKIKRKDFFLFGTLPRAIGIALFGILLSLWWF